MKHLGRDGLTIGVLLAAPVALAVLPFDPGPGGQRSLAQSVPTAVPGQRIIHTQDFWLFDAIRLSDANGN
jgi:hypothetical protein